MPPPPRPLIDRSAAEILVWCCSLLSTGALLAIDLFKFGKLDPTLLGIFGGCVAASLARGTRSGLPPQQDEMSAAELLYLRQVRDLMRERLKIQDQLEETTGELRRLQGVVEREVDDDPTRRSR